MSERIKRRKFGQIGSKQAWRNVIHHLKPEELKQMCLMNNEFLVECRHRMCGMLFVEFQITEFTGNVPKYRLPYLFKAICSSTKDLEALQKLRNNLFDSIEILILGSDVNEEIRIWPKNLHILRLGVKYTCILTDLPEDLLALTLGCNYNQTLDSLPQKLQYLCLGVNFNQTIDSLPDSIEWLKVSVGFRQPITKLPNNLKILEFPAYSDFKHQLPDVPPTLHTISFPGGYNQPIPKGFVRTVDYEEKIRYVRKSKEAQD